MRFLLDNDVDAGVGQVIRQLGHECWTAAECGLTEADDDSVSVYADDKSAVVISHDKDFARRRIARTFGWHVRLSCAQPDGQDVIRLQFDRIVELLHRRTAIVLIVSRTQVETRGPNWA